MMLLINHCLTTKAEPQDWWLLFIYYVTLDECYFILWVLIFNL